MQNRIQIWHIIIFSAVLGIAIAFEMPSLSALVPELVKREEIAPAVALDRSVFHGSRLIGPSVAGLAVGWWGAASAFFGNALSFLALIVALMSLPKRTLGTAEEEEQRRSGIGEGFRYVRSNRIIMSMILLIALNTIFISICALRINVALVIAVIAWIGVNNTAHRAVFGGDLGLYAAP